MHLYKKDLIGDHFTPSLNTTCDEQYGIYRSSDGMRVSDKQSSDCWLAYLAADGGEAYCQVRNNLAASPK